MASDDFDTSHLKGEARLLADAIRAWLRERLGEEPYGGGCRAFYSPEEWKARGERYGTTSVLVLCHDGGSMAPYLAWDYEFYKGIEDFQNFLLGLGYMAEQCTAWHSAVYKD